MKPPINQLFDKLAAEGFKKPTLRAMGYLFKRAPDHGANKGAVYVTKDGEYLGKITTDGKFFISAEHGKAIYPIVYDPIEEAIKHGHATGECAICGRRLDNKISVYNGIGPICAEKVGYPLHYPDVESQSDDVDFNLL
jgi:hypothetical protein